MRKSFQGSPHQTIAQQLKIAVENNDNRTASLLFNKVSEEELEECKRIALQKNSPGMLFTLEGRGFIFEPPSSPVTRRSYTVSTRTPSIIESLDEYDKSLGERRSSIVHYPLDSSSNSSPRRSFSSFEFKPQPLPAEYFNKKSSQMDEHCTRYTTTSEQRPRRSSIAQSIKGLFRGKKSEQGAKAFEPEPRNSLSV